MEQSVIVHLKLSGDEFGTPDEGEIVYALEDRLSDAVRAASAGEVDGHEFGAGEAVIYMYGPDTDRLFAVVEPVLRAEPLARGGIAIKRYGPPAADTPTTRIDL